MPILKFYQLIDLFETNFMDKLPNFDQKPSNFVKNWAIMGIFGKEKVNKAWVNLGPSRIALERICT